jgi:hypothetical protein
MTHYNRRILCFVVAFVLATATLPSAARGEGLSALRFQAIDNAYTALIPLDKERTSATEYAAAHAACDALDASDRLLGAFKPVCASSVRGAQAAEVLGDCNGRRSCLTALRSLRRTIVRSLSRQRRFDRAVNAIVTASACRRSLRSSARDRRSARQLLSVLKDLEVALDTGSARRLREAERKIERADTGLSTRTQRRRFRAACR